MSILQGLGVLNFNHFSLLLPFFTPGPRLPPIENTWLDSPRQSQLQMSFHSTAGEAAAPPTPLPHDPRQRVLELCSQKEPLPITQCFTDWYYTSLLLLFCSCLHHKNHRRHLVHCIVSCELFLFLWSVFINFLPNLYIYRLFITVALPTVARLARESTERCS